MDTSLKTIQNNALDRITAGAPAQALSAIRKASQRTGVNFAYLVQQASAESGFNPSAKSKSSSATGLYQFIESTWMGMVKKHGAKYGLGDLASQIGAKGRVADRALRKEILALRNDPEIASALAAEFAGENEKFLKREWGGKVGSTELYLAHFLGAGGAAAFLNARDENPLQQAALVFPDAAKSNRNVFYDTRAGRPKSLDEVYAFFDRKFEIKSDAAPAREEFQIAERPAYPSLHEETAVYSGVFTRGRMDLDSSVFGNPVSVSSARALVANPLEIMMLSQLHLPGEKSEESF